MRDRLEYLVGWSKAGRSGLGWLAILAFLTLPNCDFDPPVMDTGHEPFSSTIFCDIQDKHVPPHCASPEELLSGIPLSRAAVALTRQQSSNVGLDYSPLAIADAGCAPGQPVAVTFKGLFPDGLSRCLNCGEVIGTDPGDYVDADRACVALCEEIFGDLPIPMELMLFCTDHARASTNAGTCFAGACTDAGALKDDFADPRRTPEAVIWQDLVGVGVIGSESNTLIKYTGAPTLFDAGAASSQTITRGDGYVEFTATETDKARVLGLSTGAPPDGDPTDADIAFGIRLSAGGHVLISENGVLQTPPDMNPNLWFASYATGDRLRVAVTDNLDGTAYISYYIFPPGCPTFVCGGIPLRRTGPAPYPFRVDASLRDQAATLTDVRIVRIK